MVLVGVQLVHARRALDVRNFGFGKIRAHGRGSIGDYALHIQYTRQIEIQEIKFRFGRCIERTYGVEVFTDRV